MPNTREKMIELLSQVQYQGNAVHGYHDKYIQNSELADHLIANGVIAQQWIPVAEHLPQEDQPLAALPEVVQVLLNSGRVTVGLCNRGLKLWYHLPINRTSLVAHNYDNTPVVAWQPLAKAPGGEL